MCPKNPEISTLWCNIPFWYIFTKILRFSAVRTGDVTKFEVVRSKYVDQFKSDRTFTLILRLHHNVIKTAIRRISLAYSRISLADVAAKLKLESPKDAEYIIAKVQYEKSIFHSDKISKIERKFFQRFFVTYFSLTNC